MTNFEQMVEKLSKKDGIEYIKILTNIKDNKTNPFFYTNEVGILDIIYKNKKYDLDTTGAIKIYGPDGEVVYEKGKECNSCLPFSDDFIETDENLGRLEEMGYTWDNNNWYVLVDRKDGYDEVIDNILDEDEIYAKLVNLYKIAK